MSIIILFSIIGFYVNLFFFKLKVEHFSFYKSFFRTYLLTYLGLYITIYGNDILTFSFSTIRFGDIYSRFIIILDGIILVKLTYDELFILLLGEISLLLMLTCFISDEQFVLYVIYLKLALDLLLGNFELELLPKHCCVLYFCKSNI